MKLTTIQLFTAKPAQLRSLLFNSKMDAKQPCYLLCGLPKPVECRLKDGEGGVGNTRECISDKGVIIPEILEWKPSETLRFALKETDIILVPA